MRSRMSFAWQRKSKRKSKAKSKVKSAAGWIVHGSFLTPSTITDCADAVAETLLTFDFCLLLLTCLA